MKLAVISVLPELTRQVVAAGVVGRAFERGLIEFEVIDLRDFSEGPHRAIDDRPYGGGAGMLLSPEPLSKAIEAARQGLPGARVGLLSPQGEKFNQPLASSLAQLDSLILVCGRYEGVDERIVDDFVDFELSIGDYVLTGGELAAMVVVDAVVRLLPGVVGDSASLEADSFSEKLLDHPHYTRPQSFNGQVPPAVLLSGDHGAISRWRRREMLGRTWERRPDLLQWDRLDQSDQALLQSWITDSTGASTGKAG